MNRSKGYLLALVVVLTFLSLQLVLPFLQYVLAGALLAFVLYPLQRRLERRVSPTVAALSLVVVAVVAFVVPFVVVVAMFAGDAAALVQSLDTESLRLSAVESYVADLTGVEVDLAQHLSDAAQQGGSIVLEQATGWFAAATHALIGFGLALFLVYYLLKDGRKLLAWIRERTPLPVEVQDELYGELEDVMWAVLAGHVLIAVVQGVVAGLGLFATGVPNAAFWTGVMIVLALIPLVGAPLVWGPAAVYLFVTGAPVLAVALAVYGATVVAITDDYLRPIVVDRYAQLNPAVIIVGVLGGIYAFGVMGLFFGPVIAGALIQTVEVVDDYYDRLEDEPGTA